MSARRRETRVGLLRALASCVDCGWTVESRNAQAVGAQHHDKTGHYVQVEITRAVLYGHAKGESP